MKTLNEIQATFVETDDPFISGDLPENPPIEGTIAVTDDGLHIKLKPYQPGTVAEMLGADTTLVAEFDIPKDEITRVKVTIRPNPPDSYPADSMQFVESTLEIFKKDPNEVVEEFRYLFCSGAYWIKALRKMLKEKYSINVEDISESRNR